MGRGRSSNPLGNNQVLYQLSYHAMKLGWTTGYDPATAGFTSQDSTN